MREGLILSKLEGQNVSAGPLEPIEARGRGVKVESVGNRGHVK